MDVQYASVLERFRAAPHGKLFCLHGTGAVFRMSLNAAARALGAGRPIVLVDGTNRFDAYYIAEFARRLAARQAPGEGRSPETFLERIFVSRAFTSFQMEAVVTGRLLPFLRRVDGDVAIIFGLLDTFYDEQVPLIEARAGLVRVIEALREMKRADIALLLASQDLRPASPERQGLFPLLARAMDQVYTVTEQETIQLNRRRYGPHGADIHDGDPAGDGKLDKIPPGPPPRGPGGA
jgi:hypothetical protein